MQSHDFHHHLITVGCAVKCAGTWAVVGSRLRFEQFLEQRQHAKGLPLAVRQHADAADRHHRAHHHFAGETRLVVQLGRPLLLDHQDGRLLHGVERVDHVHEGQPALVVRVGQAVDAGHGITDGRTELGVDAADRAVGVPVLGPRIVQAEAKRILRIGRHHVGDGRRVDLAQFGKDLVAQLGHRVRFPMFRTAHLTRGPAGDASRTTGAGSRLSPAPGPARN